MTPEQLRQALGEIRGDRTVTFALLGVSESMACLTVHNAMLVPQETDELVKVTDGSAIYIIEAERVAWVRIGLPG